MREPHFKRLRPPPCQFVLQAPPSVTAHGPLHVPTCVTLHAIAPLLVIVQVQAPAWVQPDAPDHELVDLQTQVPDHASVPVLAHALAYCARPCANPCARPCSAPWQDT